MARFCGSCGGSLRETAAFCGRCGAQASTIQSVGNEFPKESELARWALPGGLLVIILVALAVGYWLFLFEPNDGARGASDASAEVASNVTLGTARSADFDVREYCAANPNNPGPGEQDVKDIPPEVRAAKADFWRCAGGQVLVCYGGASGRSCMQQSNADPDYLANLERHCLASPDSFVPNSIAGPGREWRCQGTMLVADGNSKIDGYGYLAESWKYLEAADSSMSTPYVKNRIDTDPGEIIAPTLYGRWNDGGAGCMSIRRGDIDRSLKVKLWYCEADESFAEALVLDYDNTVSAFVHEASGLSLRSQSNQKIQISSNEGMRTSLGDGVFVIDDNVTYSKQ